MDTDDLEIRSLAVGHLPLIRACIDQLGIMDVLNAHLPRHPLAKASDAECVAVMILNIMSGRVGLWRMDQRFEHIDIELLLGEGVEAEWFHDNRLGRALDHIDAAGTDTLLSDVVLNYLNTLDPGPFSINLDHTTMSVYGRYDGHTDGPVPAFGHSKDLRPDLKQLLFSLALHGAAGIPLTMQVAPGNTSDHVANRDQLARLAEVLPRPDEATIVADCKLVDGETLGRLARAGFHFVSLMPRTIGERAHLIDKAWSEAPDASTWPVLASVAADRKDDPPRQYRGRSFIGKVPFRFDDAPSVSIPPGSAARGVDSEAPVEGPEENRAGTPSRIAANEVAEGGTAPEPPQSQPSSPGAKPARASKPPKTGGSAPTNNA